MAERTRSERRQRRADARGERRSLAAKPFEELDEAAAAQEPEGVVRTTLRQAATTAAAGALAAGVTGAVKALADRRDHKSEPEAEEKPAESEDATPQAEGAQNMERDQAAGADAQNEYADESEQEPQSEEQPQQSQPQQSQPEQGASPDEVKAVIDEAKRELQELLGLEPEKVSGFNRSDGKWTVTLEVVNLRRIPDTTDVLSTYEVELDDDRKLVSVSETRRYRRSQVEEGR